LGITRVVSLRACSGVSDAEVDDETLEGAAVGSKRFRDINGSRPERDVRVSSNNSTVT